MDDCSDVPYELQHNVKERGDTIVHLNYKGLRSIPSCLLTDSSYSHIRKIYMKRNLLTSLPENITRLSNLVELYLHSNNIKSLPDGIGEMVHLESLNLCSNKLTQLPVTIGKLRNLTKLQVSENNLKNLPSSIGDLGELTTLELMKNDLSMLPVSLCRCESLQTLNVDYNNLNTIPRQLRHLCQLGELSVCANNLIVLPQTLPVASHGKLRWLLVDNNPALHTLPLSTMTVNLGNVKSCGRTDPLGVLPGAVELLLPRNDGPVPVVMPPEFSSMNSLCDCVPSLQELSFRSVRRLASLFSERFPTNNTELSPLLQLLPPSLSTLLLEPTASCQNCRQDMFVTAFPLVLTDQSVVFVGFSCSSKCVMQFVKRSLHPDLEIIYPP